MNGNLTLESLNQARQAIAIYYATSDQVERGKVVYSRKAEYTPEFFVCHSDDLEAIKVGLDGRPLIHLRDWKPNPVMTEADTKRVKELFRQWAARYGVEV